LANGNGENSSHVAIINIAEAQNFAKSGEFVAKFVKDGEDE
jgi:hypothetical protein